ncbi:lipopolysaccharide assembly protein LapB [Salinisphaera sp. SPP-AMP-43]|uniref:lipopolysaccharide assembly protein LapB n=1 Tax=Salinisphaera sp. SPP-AMP-43 TaxID=3121288 RepID=UPI003C6E1DCC
MLNSVLVLLVLLPVAAGSGWLARARAERRRQDAEQRSASPVHADYLRGISYLVNEDADRAIETFIRVLEVDNETAETHLALGNLFRRQGDIDRALRLHQNLVARPNLSAGHRNQARYELARDYLRAGVLDRAESLFVELVDNESFAERSLNGLITIHEQVRDWEQAIVATQHLERERGSSLRPIIAQYYCELAEQAIEAEDSERARRMLKSARHAYRGCARISLVGGRLAESHRDFRTAIRAYHEVLVEDPAFATEILEPMHRCFAASDDDSGYVRFLQEFMAQIEGAAGHVAYARHLRSTGRIDEAIAHLSRYLQHEASWIGFYHLLELASADPRSNLTGPLDNLRQSLARIIEREPLYQCGHCGFSGRYLHWQCPSCRQWNTMVPRRDIKPGD